MKYMTRKRMAKLFKPSKNVEAKKIVLFNSLDNIKKISKTPNDIIHNLIKWSFSYNGVFHNSKAVVSRYICGNSSDITLKNGDNVKHVSPTYNLYKNSKYALDLVGDSHDYGDALACVNNIIKAMETGKWYIKQNPLHSFGHYAQPINKSLAISIVDNVKKTVDQILYLNDKGRIKRINKFNKKYDTAK